MHRTIEATRRMRSREEEEEEEEEALSPLKG
jgi:hypothetical protein